MLDGDFSQEKLEEARSEARAKTFFAGMEGEIAKEFHPLLQQSLLPLLAKCQKLGHNLQLVDTTNTEGLLSLTLLDNSKSVGGLRIEITVVLTCGHVVKSND